MEYHQGKYAATLASSGHFEVRNNPWYAFHGSGQDLLYLFGYLGNQQNHQ
jgi:hypothetical protein